MTKPKERKRKGYQKYFALVSPRRVWERRKKTKKERGSYKWKT
jgi:hypothetical protein